MKNKIIALVLCILMLIPHVCIASAADINLYISPDGKNTNDGLTADTPVKTFLRLSARINALREENPNSTIYVNFMDGEHQITTNVAFNAVSAEGAPVVFRPHTGASPVITGAETKNASQLKDITDEAVLAKIKTSVQDKVKYIKFDSLTSSTDAKLWYYQSTPGCLVYADGELMTIARWPNDGYAYMNNVSYDSNSNITFSYGDADAAKWLNSSSARYFGAPCYMWRWIPRAISAVDTEAGRVTIGESYDSAVKEGNPYFVYNLLEELDAPGEYYIDYTGRTVYIYPIPGTSEISVAAYFSPLLSLSGCKNLEIQNLTFKNSSGDGISVADCENIKITNCTFTGLGTKGIGVSESSGVEISNCEISNNGMYGATISGGDRNTLTAANNIIKNCELYSNSQLAWYASAGITLGGVGCTAQNNVIYDMPQHAITFGGNNHLIKGNEIYDVCLLGSDNGAIYSGRNWTMRGTVIEENYIHDVKGYLGKGGVNAVYLDDMYCGTTVRNNLFAFCSTGVFIHGGRDNNISGNMFVNCGRSVTIVNISSMGSAEYFDPETGSFYTQAAALPCTGEIWRTAYPELYAQLNESNEHAQYPKNNGVYDNISINTPEPSLSALAIQYAAKKENNRMLQAVFYK